MAHLVENRHTHPDLDRGWAWAVLFATTLWNFILGGTIKSFGVLYVELLNVFPNSSASAVGVIGLVSGISATIVSPMAGRLSDIYSSRCMAIIGSFLTAFGLFASAFGQSLTLVVLTYGVIFGSGLGVIDGPVLAMIGKYWEKRRNMASGVSFAGSSVGNLALAPLIALLINTYSVRGSFIILAGIWLNGCVVGALLRPAKKQKLVSEDKCLDIKEIKLCDKINKEENADTYQNGYTQREISEDFKKEYSRDMQVENNDEILNKDCDIELSDIVNKEQTCDIGDTDDINIGDTDDINIGDTDDIHSPSEHFIPTFADKSDKNRPAGERPASQNQTRRNCWSNMMISCLKRNFCTFRWNPHKSEYLKFLCNRKLLVNLCVVTCGMFGYYLPVIILPAYSQELGFGLYEGAGLLSILGIAEVISRLTLSAVVDLCHLKPGRVLVISYILIGTITQLALFYPSGKILVALSCAHGVLGGLSLVFMSALLVDAVGVAQLGSAMGLAVVSLNLTSSMSAFVAGFMKEMTGSYGNAIRLSAAIYFLGALTYLLDKAVYRYSRNNQSKRNSNSDLPEIRITQDDSSVFNLNSKSSSFENGCRNVRS